MKNSENTLAVTCCTSSITQGKCKWQLLSGNAVKTAAMVSMLIDHMCKVVLTVVISQVGELFFEPNFNHIGYRWLVSITDKLLLPLGRVAFPLFCFLLVEGYVHTSSRKKYLLRMVIFAAASELPFDLAFLSEYSAAVGTYPFCHLAQNVFFTLAIGIATMWIIDKCSALWHGTTGKAVLGVLLAAVGIGAAAFAAYCLKTDYKYFGVLLIAALYCCRQSRLLQVAAFAAVSAALGYICLPYAVSAVIMLMYNTTRGRSGKKYFFYVFYPAHLTILYVISLIIR